MRLVCMAIRLPTSGALVQARVKYLSTDRPRIILHCQRHPGPPAINHYQSVPSASHPNTKTTSFPQTHHFLEIHSSGLVQETQTPGKTDLVIYRSSALQKQEKAVNTVTS